MALVLVAVGDFVTREAIVAGVEAEGHDVIEINDGQEAIEVISKKMPALALIDVSLPIFNGYEVCEILRNDSSIPATLPIVLLADRDADSRDRDRVGATAYLTKNPMLHELRDMLVAQLGTEANPNVAPWNFSSGL